MIVAGVEEAGRGPVIGPMVMAIVACEEAKLYELEKLGVKDSKLLSVSKRKELFKVIKENFDYKIIILSPQIIDAALSSSDMNLNLLEARTSAKLINKIKAHKVILDCPSNNIKAYEQYVKKLLDYDIKVVAEHKADLNHIIVGAASILAKHKRDTLIEEIKKEHNVEFGSGYPSDPKTISFLKENYDKYDFFRKSWKTYKKILIQNNQKNLNNY